MIEKLNLLDRKILHELDRNSRQSAIEIGKKVHAHRNVVNFRINKLIEKEVIREFVTIISPSALGLFPCKFYLQLENFTEKKEKAILNLIENLPVYWAAKISGRWDFVIGILVKNPKELNEYKTKIIEELGEDITNKSLSILVEAPYFYRNYLLNKKEHSPIKFWIQDIKENLFDEKDLAILRILANNSRAHILDISKKVNINVKTAISRIKKLEKHGIISDYRISINLEKIGYKFFKCFISLKKADKKEIQEFMDYCSSNKNIIHLVECVGDWDLEPEFEVESNQEFYRILSEIREKFSSMIKNIETIDILKEYSYVCLPK